MQSLDSESAIFSSSNKGAQKKAARQRYIAPFFLNSFISVGYVFLFFKNFFSIYVLETDRHPSQQVRYEWPGLAAVAQIHPGGLLQGRLLLRAAQ